METDTFEYELTAEVVEYVDPFPEPEAEPVEDVFAIPEPEIAPEEIALEEVFEEPLAEGIAEEYADMEPSHITDILQAVYAAVLAVTFPEDVI